MQREVVTELLSVRMLWFLRFVKRSKKSAHLSAHMKRQVSLKDLLAIYAYFC